MAKNSIIAQGTTYRIFDSSIQTFDELPEGTYKVQFSMLSGFSLLKIDELTAGTEKVYGDHDKRVARTSGAYGAMDRSLGILMSGDKGMGKSMTTRLIADQFRQDYGLPTIIVDEKNDGLADFIDSLGECVVVFDEFEKKFPKETQNEFLSLFDGLSTQKRVYVVTVNDMFKLSDFIINRPGRFHYHIRFDYPTVEQTREYLHDQTQGVSDDQIEKAVAFSQKVKLNYDHLRALAFELTLGGSFSEIINDLNIKNLENTEYTATVTLRDGTVLVDQDQFDLFTSDTQEIECYAKVRKDEETFKRMGFSDIDARRFASRGYTAALHIKFTNEGATLLDDGSIALDLENVYVTYADENVFGDIVDAQNNIVSVTFVMAQQNNYRFNL